ncbi:MAG TPA: aminotransferase class I/II-fold pyridoxal phosphate-dependent enzyme, partial [Terriglobales bacterium]|nr:aminotransferase class I/II-fold pyridoxal phosphate-dependent enzyme [Terriglobales bacterium]
TQTAATRGISARVAQFTESVIREMTRLAMEHDAINLAQGFPDFPAPDFIKEAAVKAIREDINQYAVTWGDPLLREAIAAKYRRWYGMEVTDRHVTVCCGSTEAMISTLIAVLNPGDETVIFEPFYENYGPDSILSGATPRYVTLRQASDGWNFDRSELAAAFNEHTRAIIVNTPNNPTGKVFTRAELEFIRDLCVRWDCLAITDEIYEHIIYDGRPHVPMATLDGMAERTITISGISKTFSVTGWRVGWALAPERLAGGIRKVHDFLTVGAPAPLQIAAAHALEVGDAYCRQLSAEYTARRAKVVPELQRAGFGCTAPEGAYYVIADIAPFMEAVKGRREFTPDQEFARWLIRDLGVATVPGSSFYHDRALGANQTRFCYSKVDPTLEEAMRRIQQTSARARR